MSSKSNERSLIFEISKIKNKKIWSQEEDNTLLKYAKLYKERKKYQNIFELKLLSNVLVDTTAFVRDNKRKMDKRRR